MKNRRRFLLQAVFFTHNKEKESHTKPRQGLEKQNKQIKYKSNVSFLETQGGESHNESNKTAVHKNTRTNFYDFPTLKMKNPRKLFSARMTQLSKQQSIVQNVTTVEIEAENSQGFRISARMDGNGKPRPVTCDQVQARRRPSVSSAVWPQNHLGSSFTIEQARTHREQPAQGKASLCSWSAPG